MQKIMKGATTAPFFVHAAFEDRLQKLNSHEICTGNTK